MTSRAAVHAVGVTPTGTAIAWRATEATSASAFGLLETVPEEDGLPVGITCRVLERQLREQYADLATYVRRNEDRLLTVREESAA
ncbi:hypothetical protein BIV24_00595 [Streptomyces colonosanans]|uniref:Uncharacterized protein n=1 Tax=Streptomyces colonosanans TaxID=1428652 RepID=A0A1S2Q7Q1_9ACTN|nr:hypothetical protein BIV24_00595 [Streptomyces colonosanans]